MKGRRRPETNSSTWSRASSTSSRATARRSASCRFTLGGRCGSTTATSTSTITSGARRSPARAARTSCARSSGGSCPSSWTAPSRCGRCGSSKVSASGRWALVSKVHHCMVDGVSATDLLSVMLDRERRARATPVPAWTPAREPSAGELIAQRARQAPGHAGRRARCHRQDDRAPKRLGRARRCKRRGHGGDARRCFASRRRAR